MEAGRSAQQQRLAPTTVWVLGLAGLALVASGCATPVGVKHVDIQTAYRLHTESALSARQPSEPSKTVLRRLGLLDRFDEEPAAVLAELHGGLRPADDDDRLFALAELSFLHADRTGDRAHFLASAVYAWALLFPGDATGVQLQRSDPRLRLAYDLYNQGVAQGLTEPRDQEKTSRGAPAETSEGGGEVRLEPGARQLPFGTLQVTLDESGLSWGGYRLEQFISTTTLKVRGLRNHYRSPGLGAPLAASLAPGQASANVLGAERIGPRTKVAVTALLRLEDARASLASGQVRGRLEVYAADQASTVTVDGQAQPLEFDSDRSPRLRSITARSTRWRSPPSCAAAPSERQLPRDRTQDGLFMLQPYRPRQDPGRAGARDGIEPRTLGRAGQRARRGSADPGAVPDLGFHLRHRQPHRLLGGAAARGADGRGARVRPRRQGSGAAPHGGDRAQPGRAPDEAHRDRQRDAVLGPHQQEAVRRGPGQSPRPARSSSSRCSSRPCPSSSG